MQNLNITPMNYSFQISELLTKTGLPTSDLQDNEIEWWGLKLNDILTGVIGLERYGKFALLRSLAISEDSRGLGYGDMLVSRLEAEAKSKGVTRLFLLTDTAPKYFEKRSYNTISRGDAPPDIAGTSQFSDLCPDSSKFMVKELR